jgi:hypothetical protein
VQVKDIKVLEDIFDKSGYKSTILKRYGRKHVSIEKQIEIFIDTLFNIFMNKSFLKTHFRLQINF